MECVCKSPADLARPEVGDDGLAESDDEGGEAHHGVVLQSRGAVQETARAKRYLEMGLKPLLMRTGTMPRKARRTARMRESLWVLNQTASPKSVVD